MKPFTIVNVLACTVTLFLLLSCDKENIPITENYSERLQGLQIPKMVLGKKLENPYSTENMIKAYNLLEPRTKAAFGEDIVRTTHLYVKFIPKTEEELSILKTDSTLVLFQYPLDYEIKSYGSYRDPDIPENQPTPLYCSVPIDKPLPTDVEYEVLEDLYIPDSQKVDTKLSSVSLILTEEFIDALVNKSFEITGNANDLSPATKAKKSSWVPQGSVRYYDSIKHEELPIEGLQVRCNRWFTTYTTYTKADGSFKCKDSETFKDPANYSIVFERYDFEIRDAWLSTAKYDGPKKEGSWTVNFTNDKLSTYYSTIFRAAYKYYYGDIHGLSRPPQNSIWKTQLKIKATTRQNDKTLGYYSPGLRFIGLGSAIHLFSYNESLDITYSATIHELSHAAHWGLYKTDYNKADDFVCESWARGVELFLTQDEYPDYAIPFYSSISYTGIIRDLMDGCGIKKMCWCFYDSKKEDFVDYTTPKWYIDNVSNYSLPQIEKSLKNSRTAISWMNNLKELYQNETEIYLDDAFTFWSNK